MAAKVILMASFADLPTAGTVLPDHTQLPVSDGTFVKNFQEHPQSILLTDSIKPVLDQLHPDGQYCIGQDSGIYWRITEPPERGAEAPAWFYVPNVSPLLDGRMRRSYVLWHGVHSTADCLGICIRRRIGRTRQNSLNR